LDKKEDYITESRNVLENLPIIDDKYYLSLLKRQELRIANFENFDIRDSLKELNTISNIYIHLLDIKLYLQRNKKYEASQKCLLWIRDIAKTQFLKSMEENINIKLIELYYQTDQFTTGYQIIEQLNIQTDDLKMLEILFLQQLGKKTKLNECIEKLDTEVTKNFLNQISIEK